MTLFCDICCFIKIFRPRLGAVLSDGSVVKKIDKKGKLVVQVYNSRETRKVSLMSLFSNYYAPRIEADINFQVRQN